MRSIRQFQKALFEHYVFDLSLPKPYQYIYGNPVCTVVPMDTSRKSVFVIGAYPSAKLFAIGTEQNVPVSDHCAPFSTERYFDGQRTRVVASGKELERAYLKPLGLERSDCWITELVRVFLFKKEHVAKYRRLGCAWPARETRSQFETYALQGMQWLELELALAQPSLVVTLGAEVAGILQGVKGRRPRNALLGGKIQELRLDGAAYPVIHLAHPGAVMRTEHARNPWPRLHREEHIPTARREIRELLRN